MMLLRHNSCQCVKERPENPRPALPPVQFQLTPHTHTGINRTSFHKHCILNLFYAFLGIQGSAIAGSVAAGSTAAGSLAPAGSAASGSAAAGSPAEAGSSSRGISGGEIGCDGLSGDWISRASSAAGWTTAAAGKVWESLGEIFPEKTIKTERC